MDKLSFLEIPLFSGLDRVNLAKLLPKLESVHFQKGQVIFYQGELGDALYIIVEGKVQIRLDNEEEQIELAVLHEKESLGEMALLTGEPRSATAVALTDAKMFRLSKENFDYLLLNNNVLAVQFAGILAKRLSKQNVGAASSASSDNENEHKYIQKSVTQALLDSSLTSTHLETQQMEVRQHNQSKHIKIGIAVSLLVLLTFGFLSPNVSVQSYFSGFSEPLLYVFLALYSIGLVAAKSGFMYRLVLSILRKFPLTLRGQSLAWLMSGLVLTPLSPSVSSRVQTANSILTSLHVQSHEANLLKWVNRSFQQFSFVFINGSVSSLFLVALITTLNGEMPSFLHWMAFSIPLFLIYSSMVAVTFIKKKDDVAESFQLHESDVKDQLLVLGPLTTQEKEVIFSFLVAMVAWFVAPVSPVLFVVLIVTCFLVLYVRQKMDISFDVFLLFGMLLSVAALLQQTGGVEQLQSFVVASLPWLIASPYVFLISSILLIHILRIFFSPFAVSAMVAMIGIPLTYVVGIDATMFSVILVLASQFAISQHVFRSFVQHFVLSAVSVCIFVVGWHIFSDMQETSLSNTVQTDTNVVTVPTIFDAYELSKEEQTAFYNGNRLLLQEKLASFSQVAYEQIDITEKEQRILQSIANRWSQEIVDGMLKQKVQRVIVLNGQSQFEMIVANELEREAVKQDIEVVDRVTISSDSNQSVSILPSQMSRWQALQTTHMVVLGSEVLESRVATQLRSANRSYQLVGVRQFDDKGRDFYTRFGYEWMKMWLEENKINES